MFYADTSALVKLAVSEPESAALRGWLRATGAEIASCDLARAELLRAVRRASPDRLHAARGVLATVQLLELAPADYAAAGLVEPSDLRTLDAIHLVAALALGDELDGVVCYARRLALAAEAAGLDVIAPGS